MEEKSTEEKQLTTKQLWYQNNKHWVLPKQKERLKRIRESTIIERRCDICKIKLKTGALAKSHAQVLGHTISYERKPRPQQ